jgi:hypothetical protein
MYHRREASSAAGIAVTIYFQRVDRPMKVPLLTLLAALSLSTSAHADCSDDVCRALQKILLDRPENFTKLKGRPSAAPKGDQGWEGTQSIPGLINYCFVYARGSRAVYEYRCDAPDMEDVGWLPLDTARKMAATIKAAFQSADPKLIWYDDPASVDLAKIRGFEASEGWNGGDAANKLATKVSVFGSEATGGAVSVIVFAKPLAEPEVK